MQLYPKVSLTKDVDTIQWIFVKLWNEIAEDDDSKDKLSLGILYSLATDYFVKVDNEQGLTGIIYFHPVDEKTYQIHMNMLPGNRGAFATEAATRAISLVRDLTGFTVLQAEVPDCFPNVQKFSEDYGMVPVKRLSKSWFKNEKHYDGTQYRLEYK